MRKIPEAALCFAIKTTLLIGSFQVEPKAGEGVSRNSFIRTDGFLYRLIAVLANPVAPATKVRPVTTAAGSGAAATIAVVTTTATVL
jgi:hypothetical protein